MTGSGTAARAGAAGAVNATVQSTNWSGYAAQASGTTFSDVPGSWVQPAVGCTSRQKQYSSFWVGIDGWGTPDVVQAGISSSVASPRGCAMR